MYCFSSEHNNCFEIIVFLCVFCIRRICASDFFIAKQYGNEIHYVCVTNSSYPMSWVQEDITTRLSDSMSFFFPDIPLRELRTSFIPTPYWSQFSSSMKSEFSAIILDRRWEGLETYLTESVKRKGTLLKYYPVLRNLRDDFEIPFSIRLKQEGHVFLCDGDYPPNSNCYWLMLQARGGNRTAIRKCNSGYIPSKEEEWPKAPCSNILKEQNHSNKPNSRYFSNQKWSHLKITKKGNALSLFSVNNKKEDKNIITLEDQEAIIGVTHMIIHSKLYNGLWKIHNKEVIYITQESMRIPIGHFLHHKVNYLCYNLFIAMCTSCSMTLTLQDSRNNVIVEKVHKFSSSGWSEIKLTVENVKQNNPVKLLVSFSSSSNDRFWAIDGIRICQRKEFRGIVLLENAKCQLMSDKNDVISLSTNVQRLASSCPEHTIGDFCFPCARVFRSCERVEVCQKDKCVCSAGYQYNTCSSECAHYNYGHGCFKECLTCPYSRCNHIYGTCTIRGQCQGDYMGPKCDIQLTSLIFKKPPETTKVDYYEATVIVKDFTIEKGIDEEPENYFFQYKLGDKSKIYEWMTVGLEIKFNQSRKIIIRDLHPGTKYFFRAVIVSDNKVSYEESYVKYSSFKTLCAELTKDDVIPRPSSSSVVISIMNWRKLCSFTFHGDQAKSDPSLTNDFHFSLSISKVKNQNISDEEISFDNFENSKLIFNCSLNKSPDSFNLIIGDNKQPADCENVRNPPLREDTKYNITIFLINNFGNKSRNKTVSLTFNTPKRSIETNYNSNYFFILLCLLLVLPVSYYIFRKSKIKERVCSKSVAFQNTETPQTNMNTASNEHDHQNQELHLLEKHDYKNCTLQSSEVQTEAFYTYVKTTESCGQLRKQHEIIMETLTTYETLLDHFQIEYVDMNYIKGHELRKVYIATQLPEQSELNLFWNILWDENVLHIVLFGDISNNAHELSFERYWPDQNQNMRLDNIFIKCNASEKYEFHTCRTFTVSSNGQKRRIKQLHFSASANEYSSTIKYVNFFQEISNIPLETNSPILIHSSYGMSGNCLVLLCDISLRSATRDGVVDVMANLRKLTESTPQLIVDYNHYLLAHRIISEGLLHIKTSIDCASLDSNEPFYVGSHKTQKHLKYLQETSWLDCHFGCPQPINNEYCLVLSSNDNFNEQISKISICGFDNRWKFFVIPHQLMNTTNQFWKHIEKENISVIISPNGNLPACPHADVSSMQLYSDITIKKTNNRQFSSSYEWITVEMNNRNIEIFSMKNWPDKLIHPHNISDFVTFCMETNVILNQHQSIAVICHDSLTPAGLYITMSYNIQKIKKEGVSDICSCIRLIRSQCRHIFSDEISYKFLMKATCRYINECRLYEAR